MAALVTLVEEHNRTSISVVSSRATDCELEGFISLWKNGNLGDALLEPLQGVRPPRICNLFVLLMLPYPATVGRHWRPKGSNSEIHPARNGGGCRRLEEGGQ
jgi:hypothetical protein